LIILPHLNEHPLFEKVNKFRHEDEYIFSFENGMYKETARIYLPKKRVENRKVDFIYRKMCEDRIVTFEQGNIENIEDGWFKELYKKTCEEYQKPFRIRKMFRELKHL